MSGHVFVDETKDRDYLLVAGVAMPLDLDPVRRTLRTLAMLGQRRLHMAKERVQRRRHIVDAIVASGVTATVYEAGRSRRTELAAREACLRAVVIDAAEKSAHMLVLEQEPLIAVVGPAATHRNHPRGRMPGHAAPRAPPSPRGTAPRDPRHHRLVLSTRWNLASTSRARGHQATGRRAHFLELNATGCPSIGDSAAAVTATKPALIAQVSETGQPGWIAPYSRHTAARVHRVPRPVPLRQRRCGNAAAGRGGAHDLAETIARVRSAGSTGALLVRADSGFYDSRFIACCRRATVGFSVTARNDAAVTRAIAAIPDDAWQPIPSPGSGGGIASSARILSALGRRRRGMFALPRVRSRP